MLDKVWSENVKETLFIKGFEKTGLWPFNPPAFDDPVFAPSIVFFKTELASSSSSSCLSSSKKALEDKQEERTSKRRRGPGVNVIEERVSEGRVLNDEARLEKLRRHDAQVEEESKAREARRVDKRRRRRDEFSVSLMRFKLGIIDWNPDSKQNANKDLTMANFKDFINHEEVNLSRAVKVDNGVGTLQGLTRDKISDSLVARVRYDKSNDHFEIDANVEERSSDDDFNDEWISASGPEREYIGRTFIDVTVGEEDEFKRGKVVEVVECDSFEGVYKLTIK